MSGPRRRDRTLALLLRAGLAPAPIAAASWQEVDARIDIERLDDHEHAALCLAGSRLGELGLTSGESERIAGLVRHAWVSGQLALESVVRSDPSVAPLITGRLATVAAYLPAGRRLPVSALTPQPSWDGPTQTIEIRGASFTVPRPAGQLVDAAIRRQWSEVGCLLVFGVDTDEVATEARRRCRVAAVRHAVTKTAKILSAETVSAEQRPRLPLDPLDECLEQIRRPLDAYRAARA